MLTFGGHLEVLRQITRFVCVYFCLLNLVTVPLYLLYEVSIRVVKWVE